MTLDVHGLVDELAHSRHASGGMNAATMTFAVYFNDASVASWVKERTRMVADKHPSRVLLFDGSKETGEQHADPSETRGEWVEIGCDHSNAHELQAAVAMLELPEAPLVLAWFGSNISGDERFLTLAKMASTVVVNSSLVATDASGIEDLQHFVDEHPEVVVQDIAYLRLSAWQEIIAEFFDAPDLLEELDRITGVEVTAGSKPEMYYLLGWLASRLGWTPASGDRFQSGSKQTIAFQLIADGPPRRLSSIVLKSAEATFTASVHPDDNAAVCVEVSGAKPRERRCAPLHTVDIASLIERAILRNTRDEIFLQSLAVANAMLEHRN